MNFTDKYRLERIAEIGNLLLKTIADEGITTDVLVEDYKTQWLITTPIYNIGEQASCLSKEFVAEHDNIPWSSIAGLRHRLVHNYEGINWEMIASIVFSEIEPFIKQVEAILDELDSCSEANTD